MGVTGILCQEKYLELENSLELMKMTKEKTVFVNNNFFYLQWFKENCSELEIKSKMVATADQFNMGI